MNQQETNKVLLLLAAQGDPHKAAEIAGYLSAMVHDGKPQETAEPADQLADGIYLVFGGQSPVTYQPYIPGTVSESEKELCTGVAVKLGSKAICVDLFNVADGKDIALTLGKDTTDRKGYKNNNLDAGADWDGKGNTAHLKAVGLNPEIVLRDGHFIPSMAQWRFICLFRKELNQAMAEVGGDDLNGWYWTSTKCSAIGAWSLPLFDGGAYRNTTATSQRKVRPASAFIINP